MYILLKFITKEQFMKRKVWFAEKACKDKELVLIPKEEKVKKAIDRKR